VCQLISAFAHAVFVIRELAADNTRLAILSCHCQGALAAENLFVRRQLALFLERQFRPHRTTDASRFLMARLSRFFDGRSSLVLVKSGTLIRWHRQGFRLFWRWTSRPRGRPKFPANLQALIREMATANPIWD
jgi:putative transposase